MGAGDIDADPAGTTTAERATSEIMIQANPATVSTAGDGQHPYGTIEAYTDPNGYAGSWGRPALKSKTYPAVGCSTGPSTGPPARQPDGTTGD